MRGRGAALGVDAGEGRVLAAGGAAKSPEIVQVAADVLGAPVYAADVPDAAALGAAFRAAHGATRARARRSMRACRRTAPARRPSTSSRGRSTSRSTRPTSWRGSCGFTNDDVARGKWGAVLDRRHHLRARGLTGARKWSPVLARR